MRVTIWYHSYGRSVKRVYKRVTPASYKRAVRVLSALLRRGYCSLLTVRHNSVHAFVAEERTAEEEWSAL